MFLLDTNNWITLLKGKNPRLYDRWCSVGTNDIVVCSVVKAELWHGAHKYADPDKRRRTVDTWLAAYRSLPFDDLAARHYADLKHALETQGQLIGPNDLKIAAICLAHGLTLVTANTSEFRRVPGLRVEDWGKV
ncbi:MAG: type II toxin-antitoxin system VapC family toxin [Roseimicrobium sp.]